MPAYRFKCECGKQFVKLLDSRTPDFTCECGLVAHEVISPEISTTTYDTRDRARGKKVKKNIERTLKERSAKHNERHELEEKIDRFGLDDAEKFGWTKKVKRT